MSAEKKPEEFKIINRYFVVDNISRGLMAGHAVVVVPHSSGGFFLGHQKIDFSCANLVEQIVTKAAEFARGAAFTVILRANPKIVANSRFSREDDASDFEREATPETPCEDYKPSDIFVRKFPPHFVLEEGPCTGSVGDEIVFWSFKAQKGFSAQEQYGATDADERSQKRKRFQSAKPQKRIFRLPLYDYHMDDIAARQKTMEGRIFDGIFAKIVPGDFIEFFNRRRDRPVIVQIVRATRYPSFCEMFIAEGVPPFMPRKAKNTVQQATKEYMSFPKYREKERQHGVVALLLNFGVDQDQSHYVR